MTFQAEQEPPAHERAGGLPSYILDLLVCIVLIVMGTWFVHKALALPRDRDSVGPGTFPLFAGACLIALSAMQAVSSVLHRKTGNDVAFRRPVFVLQGMFLVLLFPEAIGRFGYYLTAAIWVPVFGWMAGIRKPLLLIVTTAIVLFLAKVIFEMFLGTLLP